MVASSLLQTLDENLAARRARVEAYQEPAWIRRTFKTSNSPAGFGVPLTRSFGYCLGAVGTICPRISLKCYTTLVTKFKGVMFQSILSLSTKPGSAALAICGTGLERFDRAGL